MFPLFEVFDILAKVGFFATIFINVIFINITVIFIKNIPKAYKRMMIAFASICILSATVELLARPCIHNFNGAVMFFSLNRNSYLSHEASEILLLFYGGFYCALISLICVQFIFRYFSVTDHKLRRLFHGKHVIIWLFYVAGTGFLYALMIYLFVQPVEYTDGYMRKEILKVYDRDINETVRFISVAYENGRVRWTNALFLASETSIVSFQYILIIFCAHGMHKTIKHELKQFSKSNRKLEKQFYYALLVQILLPTFLLNLPCGIVLSIPLLDMKISLQSGIAYAFFNLYPPLDSVATMIIVQEYRKCISQCIEPLKTSMTCGKLKRSRYNPESQHCTSKL